MRKLIPKNQGGGQLDRLKRQAFAESGWNPDAVSPRGATGPLQIMPDAYKDYQEATGDQTPYEEVKNFPHAIKVRNWIVNNISGSDYIKGKPQSEDVRLAKVYGSYNWGKTNMANYLNKAKGQGQDIYKSRKWTEGLPEETRGYIEKILLNKNLKFEKDYKRNSLENPNKKYFTK